MWASPLLSCGSGHPSLDAPAEPTACANVCPSTCTPTPTPTPFPFCADYKGLKDLIKESAAEEETAGAQGFSPRTTSLTVQRAADRRDSGALRRAALCPETLVQRLGCAPHCAVPHLS